MTGEPLDRNVPDEISERHPVPLGRYYIRRLAAAEAEVARLRELLDRILDHSDAGYQEHLTRRKAWESRKDAARPISPASTSTNNTPDQHDQQEREPKPHLDHRLDKEQP